MGGAFFVVNLSVAVFCAFALLLLTLSHGPAAVSANCAQNVCAHPCSVSQSACQNCHRIDAPAQCGGNGGGSAGGYFGGGGKTVVIHGNHKQVILRKRREHEEVMPNEDAADVVVPSSLLVRAKRGWSTKCVQNVCAHPCSVSQSECQNCRSISGPVQCSDSGSSAGYGGGGNARILRAKREWGVDVKSEIRTEKQKNKAPFGNLWRSQ